MALIGMKLIQWYIAKILRLHELHHQRIFGRLFSHMNQNIFYFDCCSCSQVPLGKIDPWKAMLADSNDLAQTDECLQPLNDKVFDYAFCLTFGNSVVDIDLVALINQNYGNHLVATLATEKTPRHHGYFA
jgi:hypothetical protein